MHNPHPGLPELDYVKPASLEEASRFLVEHAGEARPFLGGTDCIVRIRDGAWTPKYMVDVKGLEGMKALSFDPQKGLTIGAAVPMNKVAAHPDVQQHYPGLVEACHWVASYQLRSRATIVGNICNASPAGDTIGASILYGGVLKVFGPTGLPRRAAGWLLQRSGQDQPATGRHRRVHLLPRPSPRSRLPLSTSWAATSWAIWRLWA